MKIRWTRLAIADLSRIRIHIQRDNPSAAARIARRLLMAVESLVDQPGIGRPGRVPETRELVVTGTPFVIPYRVRQDELEVLRVLHGAQEWPDQLR